jgi:hypothetical protein
MSKSTIAIIRSPLPRNITAAKKLSMLRHVLGKTIVDHVANILDLEGLPTHPANTASLQPHGGEFNSS